MPLNQMISGNYQLESTYKARINLKCCNYTLHTNSKCFENSGDYGIFSFIVLIREEKKVDIIKSYKYKLHGKSIFNGRH